jgi:hypothetical protein
MSLSTSFARLRPPFKKADRNRRALPGKGEVVRKATSLIDGLGAMTASGPIADVAALEYDATPEPASGHPNQVRSEQP